ncbi:hypothetical protein ASO20_00235 [Mycoplasma sp. (ex Biomphalaria glabrata)]|uniref:hypothetical protein n=1 Tax=Mycoplasma sp. (ex Biomphalaria glabrata) TaxID=1749074 RepID=UPI00073A5CF9|nr:hypothetical protein [Mycoplasma sp. (ex Biomphalaria glabrata)]ALV23109.1 hypothetical protein ASO20_00235 [Mycoplasma sp. (ex Biomphalaria glabrata)]
MQNYFDNYYGYAIGNDLNNLTTWFGPQGTSMLSLADLKANMLAHIQTLPPASINAALDEFSLLLGTSNDQPTDDSILARDLKSALEQINTISQSWRNNYYGISGYTGLWFEYQYDISNHNWSDANNRTDLNAVRNAATTDSNKFLTEYTKLFVDGSTNLINFKSFQDSEMTKILQPIVDFYNQWYMGYFVTDTNKLESNNPTTTNGWVYSEVLGEISSTITKNKDTTEWESQYVNATYVSSTTKTNNYRDEQMNKLVSDINDNFIGDFLKKNYFGYNSGTSIPSSVQTILNWQNSTNPEAIWDMATWSGNDWTTTTASTYKIFIALDSNHITDLAAGKHFNTKLSEYSDSTAGKYGAEFINFQNKALNEEVTKLIPQYQAVYFGYTSKNDVNNSFLPGIVEMTNGNLNWVLADSISALVADPGNFQNADRVTNGKWLHNGALEKITRNLSQDDNFTAKERNAFEDDVTKIINEYKIIFRGFINDVNGNKLSFKTLGGDNALDNGVFVRTSSDVTSAIFNQTAFINYVHTFHNSTTTPTWEANIVTDYRGNENQFKDEQTNVYRSYLEEVNKKYSAVSQGYFATFNGSTLSFPNLPGWVTGPTGATIDINVAMGVLDRETYNQMITPDSSATYRLSYNAWKFYEDNIQNFTQEQANLSSKDLAASEKGFKRQTEIFNFLAESESNKSWKTEANYRGNYQNFSESKQALSNFLNQSGNPTSVADLNEISSQWFSLTQGDENTDWNNTALKHTFLFFSQYGMPLQLIYEPTNPKLLKSAKISATIVELGSGQHLLNGDVDSLTFSPSSQNGNVSYGATLIITKGFQQFTYKIISANNKFPFDQLLFTVADTSSGTPTYNLAQKITIAKNLDTPNSTENSTAAIEYDKGTFDFANESPDYDGTSSLPMPAQQGINTITSISELHHTTKAVRDIYIQIGVGYDLSSGRKIRTNISIMSPDYNNQVLSIDEVISRLPHIVPPSETSSLPSWVIPVIIAVASVTVIAPTMFFTIRKIRSRSQTGKTLKNILS